MAALARTTGPLGRAIRGLFDSLGRLATYAATFAGVMAGRWVAGLVAAAASVRGLAMALVVLRGAIIRTGIGGLIIGTGAHALNQTVGRTFQYACDAALGDARCGVDLDSAVYKASGVVDALTDDRSFDTSGRAAFRAGWFSLGMLEWTSGANAGRTAAVADHALREGAPHVALLDAPVRPIATDDGFVIRAGCDKRLETCRAKFANAVNFRGFPHIPGSDTIVRYANRGDANRGDANDGAAL